MNDVLYFFTKVVYTVLLILNIWFMYTHLFIVKHYNMRMVDSQVVYDKNHEQGDLRTLVMDTSISMSKDILSYVISIILFTTTFKLREILDRVEEQKMKEQIWKIMDEKPNSLTEKLLV